MHLPWIICIIKDGVVPIVHLPVFEMILEITIVYIYTADGPTRPSSRRINPLIKEFLTIRDLVKCKKTELREIPMIGQIGIQISDDLVGTLASAYVLCYPALLCPNFGGLK